MPVISNRYNLLSGKRTIFELVVRGITKRGAVKIDYVYTFERGYRVHVVDGYLCA
ncbi:MAG TPA: hypothetical protein VJW17_12285 [Pyrinomonadaceae bacterium]|nr:hypothetical protein [Pyrinomonadaceae bacterium]